MSFAPPLKGTPRPAGLERLTEILAPGPAPACSMRPMRVCLGGEEARAVLRVRMREGGRAAFATYHLCEACARAGGDDLAELRRIRTYTSAPAPSGSDEPAEEPTVWDAELADVG